MMPGNQTTAIAPAQERRCVGMKILIAPDSFKGSAASGAAAQAIQDGLQSILPQAELVQIPIADGGEGTMAALLHAHPGRQYTALVSDPLGNPQHADFAMLENNTAVLELAQASGLTLVPKGKRNPAVTTSYGTGELCLAALKAGAKKILIGLGGSATNDGGVGLLQALGAHFLDEAGQELPRGGLALQQLAKIDLQSLDIRLQSCEIIGICDVRNPLCGPQGASTVYGPQKGASPELVCQLDNAVAHYADVIQQQLGQEIRSIPGSGAAGGVGGGLLACCQAKLQPGIETVLEWNHFEQHLNHTDFIITGEGQIDQSSTFGKAPVGIGKLAKKHGVPVVAVTGKIGPGAEAVYHLGIDRIIPLADPPLPLADSIAQTIELLHHCGVQIGLFWQAGTLFPGSKPQN